MAETVGWLADKLSIVELKLYHMREQAAREDKPAEFRDACRSRISVLQEQRDDLAAELTALLEAKPGEPLLAPRANLGRRARALRLLPHVVDLELDDAQLVGEPPHGLSHGPPPRARRARRPSPPRRCAR